MTGRVQTLRSNVAGNRPSGRAPGELYVNWPDKQLGVVDSTATAVDLLAVRFFSATTSYNPGDYVVQGGKLYTAKAAVPPGAFNSTQWSLTGGNVNVGDAPPATPDVGTMWFDSAGGQLYVWYDDGNTKQWVIATNAAKTDLSGLLPLAGGTMTGPITLAADPVSAMQPATKQYVDGSIRYPNLVINGDMTLDQRNGSAQTAMTGSIYIIDRWRFSTNVAGAKGNAGTVAINGATAGFFGWCLQWNGTAAYTPAAAESFAIYQGIEQSRFADAWFGTASARPLLLEFWAAANVAGTYGGSLRNGAGNRSYAFTYTIAAVNTWQKFRISIPGDTAGTWSVGWTAMAAILTFGLGAGANFAGAPGAWAAANYVTATGAINVVANASAQLEFTGVGLMIGAAAQNGEPEFKSFKDNLNDCLRYYRNPDMTFLVTGYNNAGAANYASWLYPVTMRIAPTLTVTTTGGYINCSGLAIPNAQATGFRATATVTAAGNAVINFTATFEADF